MYYVLTLIKVDFPISRQISILFYMYGNSFKDVK